MTRTKLGLMGLCAVVIGVMAMSASSAQAALSWLVLNSAGTVATEITENAKGEANLLVELVGKPDTPHIVLLSNPGVMVSIVCNNFALNNIHLAAAGALKTGGTVTFSGCEARSGTFASLANVLKETTKLPCTVKAGGGGEGVVTTQKGKGKLVLNTSKEVLTEITPETGTTFVTLLFGGSECSLPEEDPVTGTLFLKDCNNQALVHAKQHLVEEGAGTTLKLGGVAATLLGSGFIELGGAHKELKWAGMDV